MKVTVYFGNIRVIVPCGNGDILVRDLMDLAITRYKKATGKPPSSLVTIHNLKSSRDEGILYPDDQLNDVADDREQIIAVFEENCSPLPPYNGGDGASISSVRTDSPDMFSVEVSSHSSIPYIHSDVDIAEHPIPSGVTPLQVRRGSEPALNNLCPLSPVPDPSKRWSTAIVMNTNNSCRQENLSDEDFASPEENLESNNESKLCSMPFSRGSGRLSILGNNPETFRWVEAADRQIIKDSQHESSKTPEVLVTQVSDSHIENEIDSETSSTSDERETTVILKNETGPLGIHVVPDYDSKGRDTGLVIQGIESGGRIDRDGRFHIGDRITEINGQSLQDVSFQTAQEIFKNALKTTEIKLELVKGSGSSQSKTAAVPRKPPPPVYPKPLLMPDHRKVEDETALVEGEERVGGISTKVATVTPTKKIPSSTTHRLATANTRKIGKKLPIQLIKGNSGLGFSITTRDNPAGGNCPIYIKNVLPKGAAIEDGQLQPGDRLLEVNGIEMTGKTQAEAVSILRNTQLGGVVNLVVSRQETDIILNSDHDTEQASKKIENEAGLFPWKHREILTFQIPLNDSGSAGLGVSVKGKSTSGPNGPSDLGIFIKSVILGGAASKDGRLHTNDQLVNINGISLLGMSNSSAMETLRKAMTQVDGPVPNAIILTVARRISSTAVEEHDNSSVHQKPDSLLSTSEDSYITSVDGSAEKCLNENQIYVKSINCNMNSLSPSPNDATSTVKEMSKDAVDRDHKLDANLPGCNPVIERLTGQVSSGRFNKNQNETYLYSNHDKVQQMLCRIDDDRNNMTYSPTVNLSSGETVMIEEEYHPNTTAHDPTLRQDKTYAQSHKEGEKLNISNSEGSRVMPTSNQITLEEANAAGFARDGFGRQSMSEKRHAQLDARNTDTYQRNKKAREERERQRQIFEQEYILEKQQQIETSQTLKELSGISDSSGPVISNEEEQLGPSLGLRKSSSLESLQTMIQELNKDEEAAKKAMQSSNTRSSRSRGCNESFRAAVDRSYEAPTPSTMETLEEESESGSSVNQILIRTADINHVSQSANVTDTYHDDMLHMYGRNSKSKKKGLFKGLGSVFKFGKNRKNPQDLKMKLGEETTQDQEAFQPQQNTCKELERNQDHFRKLNEPQKKIQSQPPRENISSSAEPLINRQERMQNLREQHQRLHQKRQGQYPLEQEEEFYEKEIKENESKHKAEMEIMHTRSRSLDMHKESEPSNNKTGCGDINRYSHYMNYKEIQQHIHQYLHQDQVHRHSKIPNRTDCTSVQNHQDRPSSNYFEYESVQLHRHTISQGSELDTNSLPRGAHIVDHALVHPQNHVNKHFHLHESHESGGYGRRNMHHYYPPNSALYSHIVPGSKV